MKKNIIILLLITLSILIGNGCSSQNNKKFDTVIFYSPHADDEVLSMGASILQAKKENKDVIVILLSKGLASSAFPSVNKKLADHNLPPITIEEFGNARVAEFKKSVRQLGVNANQVYVYNLPDGHFSANEIKNIMLEFSSKYPNAQHHAMTYHDPHTDHAATGKALKQLIEDHKIKYGIYHIPIQEYENIPFDKIEKVPFFDRQKI